jgi:type VI secretion system secreted protein VgrG
MSDPTIVNVAAIVEGQSYQVLSLRIAQRYATVGRAECELTDDEQGPHSSGMEPSALIGKTIQLSMDRANGGSQTSFVGVVIEAAHVAADTTRPYVRLVATPRMWRLSKRSDCRVFQQMTTKDIVADVLDRAGVTDVEWQLTGSYEPREYCVQHRETDLDFALRLLAEDGISFAIEARDGVDFTVFCDGELGDILGATELPYAAEFGFDTARDCVERLEQVVQLKSDKVTLRDYDFERPDFELSAAEGEGTLETYVFPARSNQESVASHYAQVLLESLQADRELLKGESQALHLAVGRRFTVTDHPYEPLNQTYLLLEVEHRYRASRWASEDASREGSGCSFVAMPVTTGPYRPTRKQARAVPGYESVAVVGPAGSEIHPDEFGRVKAQHFWDREGDGSDKASCFMRTTQLPLGGGLLTPRVGWEVTVRNIDGDPDMPIVTGRMYTAKAPPPYALPEHKTRMSFQTATSPGGGSVNELRFDDKKGSEEMFMNASKNMSVGAGNNATETVGGNETREIGSNQDLDVTGAKSSVTGTQVWSIGGNQDVGVTTYGVDQNGGAHTLSVGGNRDLTIGGDHRRLVGGASGMTVSGMQVDLVAGSVTEATTSTMNDTIGTALVEIAGGGRSVTCTSRVETVGSLKAVLCTGGRGVEVGGSMTHDVAGALLIKTKGEFNDNSKGDITDIVGGAQVIKAVDVTFTAESLLTVVCGGSTLTLTPGSVSLVGATVKLDGVTPQTAALIKDN